MQSPRRSVAPIGLRPALPLLLGGILAMGAGGAVAAQASTSTESTRPNVWWLETDSILTRDLVHVGVGTFDDVGVVRVDYTLDDEPIASSTTGPNFTVTFSTLGLEEGPHRLFARAYDGDGNSEGTSSYRGVSIDLTAPVLLSPLSSTSHTAGGYSTDPTIEVTFGNVSDDNALAGYDYGWSTSSTSAPDPTWEASGLGKSLVSPSLADGAWWFHLRLVDSVGNERRLSAGPFRVDRVAPTAATSPLAAVQPRTAFDVAWSGADAAGSPVTHDVRYRRAAWNGGFGTHALWKSNVTTKSATFTGAAGSTYCFSSRARDKAGNVSGWSAERCTVVPLDDRAFAASSGWTRNSTLDTRYFGGTFSRTSVVSSELARTDIQAKRLFLVATTCPSCGSVAVLWNGTIVARVNLATTDGRTTHRKVIALPVLPAVQNGTLVLKVATSGKLVEIDGVAVGRL